MQGQTIARRGRALGLALLLWIAISGAVRPPWLLAAATSASTTAATPAPLTVQLALDRAVYTAQDPVKLTLFVRNDGSERIDLMLPYAYPCNADFATLSVAGQEVWRASAGRVCATVVTSLSLAPGEQETFETIWDQTTNQGTPVDPSAYLAIGEVRAVGIFPLRSQPVPFSIALPVQPAGCQFVLGFGTLRSLLGPPLVGECLEHEHVNPVNGNAEQRTTGGLLVWRKADNWTAFTDGYHTWVNGPDGLQQRLNTERFQWEADAHDPV